MSSSPPFDGSRDVLSGHLEALFALAQVVSSGTEEAVELVEATLRRAAAGRVRMAAPDPGASERARIELYRLLLEVRSDRTAGGERLADERSAATAGGERLADERSAATAGVERAPDDVSDRTAGGEGTAYDVSEWTAGGWRPAIEAPEATGGGEPPAIEALERANADMSELKRRLAQRWVDEAAPAAFAVLPAEDRILLLLCDTQRMSCAEAGRVLQIDPDVACSRLEQARAAFDRSVYEDVTSLQRRLLEIGLTGSWRRDALRRVVDRELAAVPPTLEPSLVAAAESARQGRAAVTRRSRARANRRAGMRKVLARASVVLLIIAVAGLLGYGFSTMTSRAPDLNLISLSAAQAEGVEVAFQTTSAEQGERFVRDRLGRRITIPNISGSALQGIAIRAVADGAEVPVVVYGNPDGSQPIVIYVYSYAFLDANTGRLQLSSDVLSQIETEGHFDLHDLGESRALVFRHTDDIYIAVTDGDADELRDRISFPS